MEKESINGNKEPVQSGFASLEHLNEDFDPDKATRLRAELSKNDEDAQEEISQSPEHEMMQEANKEKTASDIMEKIDEYKLFLKPFDKSLNTVLLEESKRRTEDLEYLTEVINELADNDGEQKSLDDVSYKEIFERCSADRRAAVGRYNALNLKIRDLYQSSNYFSRKFGKDAQKLKDYRSEQEKCTDIEAAQNRRLGLLINLAGKDR